MQSTDAVNPDASTLDITRVGYLNNKGEQHGNTN